MKVRATNGKCRRREEEKARRERKWKRDMHVLEGILEIKVANEMAEFAGQFFGLVEQVPHNADANDGLTGMNESEQPVAGVNPSLPVHTSVVLNDPLLLFPGDIHPVYESDYD